MAFDDELQQALGSGGPSFDDELQQALGGRQAPPPAQSGGWWDSVTEGAGDALRGLNQGLYMGGSDELEALSPDRTLQQARNANAQAEDRSPWLYNGAKTLGYVPGMLVGPATAAGRVAASGLQGVIGGALGSDSENLDDLGSDAAKGGMWGLGGGMLGEGASAAMNWLSQGAKNVGTSLRRANAGGTQGELDAIRRNQGMDQMQSGLDDDFESLGLADGWKPQSAADVYNRLDPEGVANGVIPQAGQRMGSALDDASAAGVTGSWDSVRGLMDNANDARLRAAPMPTQDMLAQNSEVSRIASQELPPHLSPPPFDEAIPSNPDFDMNEATPRGLQNQKVAFGQSAYPPPGKVSLVSDAPKPEAYQDAYGAVRGELGDTMEGTPYNSDFLQGSQTIQQATPVAEMAGTRAASNKAGSGLFNPMTMGGALGGAAAGGLVGGVPGLVTGAAMGGAANYVGRNYGQDLAGIGMREAASPALGAMGTGAKVGGMVAGPGGANSQTDVNDNGGTRGYLLTQAAMAIMRQPGELGPYEKQFWDAANDEQSDAVSNLIRKLSHTDDTFRTQYLPKLQQLTSENF